MRSFLLRCVVVVMGMLAFVGTGTSARAGSPLSNDPAPLAVCQDTIRTAALRLADDVRRGVGGCLTRGIECLVGPAGDEIAGDQIDCCERAASRCDGDLRKVDKARARFLTYVTRRRCAVLPFEDVMAGLGYDVLFGRCEAKLDTLDGLAGCLAHLMIAATSCNIGTTELPRSAESLACLGIGDRFLAATGADLATCADLRPPSASPTPPSTATPRSTATPVGSATPLVTASSVVTATPAVTAAAPSPTITSIVATTTRTATPAPTTTPVPTATATPLASASATKSATPIMTPTVIGTPVATTTATRSPTSTVIAATATRTATPVLTSTPIATATATPIVTATRTATPVVTATPISTSTATKTSTPTSTRTPTPTATATGPVCGNGTKEKGEDCDDGNTLDCDSCPSDCHTAPADCTPETGMVRASQKVSLELASGEPLTSASFCLRYPPSSVGFTGTGAIPARISGFTGQTSLADFNNSAKIALLGRNALSELTLTVNFDLCKGQTAPLPAAYSCAVVSASNAGTTISPETVQCVPVAP